MTWTEVLEQMRGEVSGKYGPNVRLRDLLEATGPPSGDPDAFISAHIPECIASLTEQIGHSPSLVIPPWDPESLEAEDGEVVDDEALADIIEQDLYY